jgi:hypothetical protein
VLPRHTGHIPPVRGAARGSIRGLGEVIFGIAPIAWTGRRRITGISGRSDLEPFASASVLVFDRVGRAPSMQSPIPASRSGRFFSADVSAVARGVSVRPVFGLLASSTPRAFFAFAPCHLLTARTCTAKHGIHAGVGVAIAFKRFG